MFLVFLMQCFFLITCIDISYLEGLQVGRQAPSSWLCLLWYFFLSASCQRHRVDQSKILKENICGLISSISTVCCVLACLKPPDSALQRSFYVVSHNPALLRTGLLKTRNDGPGEKNLFVGFQVLLESARKHLNPIMSINQIILHDWSAILGLVPTSHY